MSLPQPSPRRVYLDHAATTPVRPEVEAAMAPFFSGHFGNASSLHSEGKKAREALEQARETIRVACGATDHDLHFISGGTEANNAALVGVLLAAIEERRTAQATLRRTIVASQVEHPSVLGARPLVEALGGLWRDVAPEASGRVDVAKLSDSIRDDALLLSLQWANNEVGVLQPVAEAVQLARSRGVWIHSDAVQALGKLPIDLSTSAPDLVTISAHKVCGPKGIGGLFVRRGVPIQPLLRGGAQEGGLRAGTENVALSVGFARAVELAVAEREDTMARVGFLRERLLREIAERWPGAVVSSGETACLPTIVQVSFPWVEGESLVKMLDWHGVAASTGSACNAGARKPSHVLRAMGRSESEIRGSLRFSLGPSTIPADISLAIEALERSLKQLGELLPR